MVGDRMDLARALVTEDTSIDTDLVPTLLLLITVSNVLEVLEKGARATLILAIVSSYLVRSV